MAVTSDAPLLQKVELIGSTGSNVGIDDVKQNHKKLMNNGHNIDDKTMELIDIFGGIDVVLQHYLSEKCNSKLTQSQLCDINYILLSTDEDEDTHNMEDIGTLYISPNNTFLHQCLNHNLSSKIINIIFGNYCSFGMTLIVILLAVLPWFHSGYLTGFIWWIVIGILGVYVILILLSLNRTITNHVMSSFEFWFKFIYFIKYCICYEIYMTHWKIPIYYTVLFNILNFVFLMFIIEYSLIDALRASVLFKATFMIIGSIGMSIWAFVWTFYWTELFVSHKLFNTDVHFDIGALGASSLRILSVFMVKQTIYSIYKKSESTSIKHPIKIVFL
eukprot:222479_1